MNDNVLSETCDPADAVLQNGSIESGEQDRYVYGDTVTFTCNENFVLQGNNFIRCLGSEFSSAVPTCIGL